MSRINSLLDTYDPVSAEARKGLQEIEDLKTQQVELEGAGTETSKLRADAIKGEIVDWFFKNCTPEFFTTKLEDRYFFEVCFPLIIDAYGKKRVNQVFWE